MLKIAAHVLMLASAAGMILAGYAFVQAVIQAQPAFVSNACFGAFVVALICFIAALFTARGLDHV